ncbi:hypothetical protein F4678DRAFT_172315 [Xylaria arbuscula]|nr:hypothetical protein F4678DRAFT_172315 [Xylaria arbuscula]
MKRPSGQSVLPKLQASTRLWECQHRHYRRWRPRPGEPLRKQFPTFEISNLLLDLDADGVKGVRAYDASLDGAPMSAAEWKKRELEPVRERVAAFENEHDEYESKFKSISSRRFHPLHINNFDFLALALLHSPSAPKTAVRASAHAASLNSVLDQNGVPHTIRHDMSSTIAYMLSRHHSIPYSLPLEEMRPMDFNETLAFADIDRLVTGAIQTPQGCQMLSKSLDHLHEPLSAVVGTEPVRVLSLLNNILINFDHYALPLSDKFYKLGIWASLRCRAIVATRQYLERMLKHGNCNDKFIDSILSYLLNNSTALYPFDFSKFQLDASSRLQAVYSLLTGYIPGESQLTFPLRSFVSRKKPRGFYLYIQCLARLGAFRTIWHEWHETNSASHSMDSDAQQGSAFKKEDEFAKAIVEALAMSSGIRKLAISPEFTNVTGQFQEDSQLDLLFISRSAEARSLPTKSIIILDRTHMYAAYQQSVYQIFQEKSIQKALSALQAFLMNEKFFSG